MSIKKHYTKELRKYSTKRLNEYLNLQKMYLTITSGVLLLSISSIPWFIQKDLKLHDEIDGLNVAQIILSKGIQKEINTTTEQNITIIHTFNELYTTRKIIYEAEEKYKNKNYNTEEDLKIKTLIELSKENFALLYPKLLTVFNPSNNTYKKLNEENPDKLAINDENIFVLLSFIFLIIVTLYIIYFIYKINWSLVEIDRRDSKKIIPRRNNK